MSDREGEISYDIPYMWNLKGNYANKLTKQKETHREDELLVARGEETVIGFQIDMYVLFKTGNKQAPTV